MSGEKISINEHGKWRQFFATLIINISALSYGLTIGWSSPIAPLLQTNQTPVGKVPMSDEQIAWMNGALCLGALCFLPICGFLTERFGRKIAGCLIAVPSTACWLLISFATNFWCLLAARIFAGIAGSLALIVLPLYVSEISGDSVRGQNGSILVFAVNIGIVVAYVLGATLPYQVFGLCAFATPILFLFGFCFMPETPIYLMRKGRIDEATRSLLWLKNNDKTTVDHELSRLSALAKENTANNNKSVGFRDLFRDRGTFKGLMIAMALLGGQQFAGISAVVTYAAKIFKMSGSSLDANTASILIGLIQVFGSWLSTVMMERAGRRSLILISCGGMAICHSILGTFLLIQSLGYEVKSFSWIPEVSVSFYAITYCLGMGPAPFVVASEVFAADIAGFANSIAMTFMWIIAFLSMKCFPAVVNALGMDGSFYLLATFCVCTFFFTYFFIPETKGRSIESILDELNGVTKGGRDGEYRRTSVELIGEIPRSPV